MRLLLAIAAILATGCVRLATVTPALAPTQPPPPLPEPDSYVTLPVDVPGLDLNAVASSIPPVFGDSKYEDIPLHGADLVNYMMWRDPLEPRLEGSTISMRFHPYFYISIGDAYDPVVQCGFRHETAQERLIGITSTVTWAAGWSLTSETKWGFLPVEPTPRPAPRPCTLGTGPWEYDAESRLNNVFTEKLNELAKKLDKDVAKKTNFTRAWGLLTRTIAVAPDVYLQLRPYAASAAPIASAATTTAGVYDLRSTIEVAARPRLFFGAAPPPDESERPELQTAVPSREGFEVHFDAALTFAQATALIAPRFPIVQQFGRHKLVFCNPVLRPSGARVVLEVDLYSLVAESQRQPGVWGFAKWLVTSVRDAFLDLAWTSSAKVYFVGTPSVDVPRRDVWFPDLDFTVETQSVLLHGLGWVTRTLLLDDLRGIARLNFGEEIDRMYKTLNVALNQRVGDGRLDGYTNEVKPDTVFVTDDTIVARAHASGRVSLTMPPPAVP